MKQEGVEDYMAGEEGPTRRCGRIPRRKRRKFFFLSLFQQAFIPFPPSSPHRSCLLDDDEDNEDEDDHLTSLFVCCFPFRFSPLSALSFYRLPPLICARKRRSRLKRKSRGVRFRRKTNKAK